VTALPTDSAVDPGVYDTIELAPKSYDALIAARHAAMVESGAGIEGRDFAQGSINHVVLNALMRRDLVANVGPGAWRLTDAGALSPIRKKCP
jgi:hypothetical protein